MDPACVEVVGQDGVESAGAAGDDVGAVEGCVQVVENGDASVSGRDYLGPLSVPVHDPDLSPRADVDERFQETPCLGAGADDREDPGPLGTKEVGGQRRCHRAPQLGDAFGVGRQVRAPKGLAR